MLKNPTRIEIVSSSISRLSSMSERSRIVAYKILAKKYEDVRITLIDKKTDLNELILRKPDIVFLGMKYITIDSPSSLLGKQKLWISDYLDLHEIEYTGSGQIAHELELNKPLAKQRVISAGLKTAKYLVIKQGKKLPVLDMPLNYPVFIKPADRGGGVGIDDNSLAYNYGSVATKINSIHSLLESDVLIEEYLPGREFSVAILKEAELDNYCLMPIELAAPEGLDESCLLSGEVKSSNTEQILEVTDIKLKQAITRLALDAFNSLGGRDYGRIDIRLDANGDPHFLEANLLPSLISGYGSFPKACVLNESLDYESMINKIVDLAVQRTKEEFDISLPILEFDSDISPLLATV